MITSANVTSFVRSLIGEATAKWWTDAEITLYVQFAMSRVQGEFYPWMWDIKKTYTTLTFVAGVASLPSDCFKVSHVNDSEGHKIRGTIGENEYFKYTNDTSAPTTHIVWYMKAADEVTDFPDSMRALVAVEAAMLARGKNKEITADLFEMQKMFRQAATVDLSMTTVGQIQEMQDFSEERSFADGAWMFDDGKIRLLQSTTNA